MSKLEELLDGVEVEWKTLGEVGELIRGNGLQKKDFTETGVGCIHYGQIYTYYGTYTYKTKSFVSEEFAKKARMAKYGDLVIATTSENDEDVCKAVAWLGDEEIAVSNDACFYSHHLHPKYVAYFFQTELFQKQKRPLITGTKVRRVNADDLAKIKIPIPPLEVQKEIVRILDKFSTLTAELQAELQARKSQYEYYRNQLLAYPVEESDQASLRSGRSATSIQDNDNSSQPQSTPNPHTPNSVLQPQGKVVWKTLGEVSSINRGRRLVKRQLEKKGKYAVYQNCLNPLGFYNENNVESGTTFIICAGSAGEIGYSDVAFWAADDVYYFVTKDKLLNKYLYYFLLTQQSKIYSQVRRSSIPRLSKTAFENLKIPIPSLSEQQRIVTILDKFDTLVNSITEGLPKEIELRQKQYEYYRDKLLSFARRGEPMCSPNKICSTNKKMNHMNARI